MTDNKVINTSKDLDEKNIKETLKLIFSSISNKFVNCKHLFSEDYINITKVGDMTTLNIWIDIVETPDFIKNLECEPLEYFKLSINNDLAYVIFSLKTEFKNDQNNTEYKLSSGHLAILKKIDNLWKLECLQESSRRPTNNAPRICIDSSHIKTAIEGKKNNTQQDVSNTNVKISSNN